MSVCLRESHAPGILRPSEPQKLPSRNKHLKKLPREGKKVKGQVTGFCTRSLKTSRALLQQRPSPARWGTEGSYLSKVSGACKNQCGLNCPKKEKTKQTFCKSSPGHSVSPFLEIFASQKLSIWSHPLKSVLQMDRQTDNNRGITTASKYVGGGNKLMLNNLTL